MGDIHDELLTQPAGSTFSASATSSALGVNPGSTTIEPPADVVAEAIDELVPSPVAAASWVADVVTVAIGVTFDVELTTTVLVTGVIVAVSVTAWVRVIVTGTVTVTDALRLRSRLFPESG